MISSLILIFSSADFIFRAFNLSDGIYKENKISSLKKDYDNNLKELQNYLIEIEKLEANKKEISNLKNKLEQNINNLTNDLESIKKLKEKELLLQTESKQIKMENN